MALPDVQMKGITVNAKIIILVHDQMIKINHVKSDDNNVQT